MSQSWTPERIKAELKARHLTQRDIAAMVGVTRPAVNHCINQTYPLYKGHRIRRAIAAHLGVPVEQIWPDETQGEDTAC